MLLEVPAQERGAPYATISFSLAWFRSELVTNWPWNLDPRTVDVWQVRIRMQNSGVTIKQSWIPLFAGRSPSEGPAPGGSLES